MVTFEESLARKKSRLKKRNSGRNNPSKKFNKPRGKGSHKPEFTKVKCDSCGNKCEVPFKPNSNKPVYCDSCYSKPKNPDNSNISERDIDIINEKLNKIMKALKIE